MAINFPNSPTDGQLYTHFATQFRYDATLGVWYAVQNNDSSVVAQTAFSVANTGIVTMNVNIFTANGTWDKPSNLVSIIVEVQGGGGGGGGADGDATNPATGTGGGAGGYIKKTYLESQLNVSETVIVGPGGAAGTGTFAGDNNGGDGLLSAFKNLVAFGGSGGLGRTGTTTNHIMGGTGGEAANGDINIPGKRGQPARTVGGVAYNTSAGGDAFLGFGGNAPDMTADAISYDGTGYGSGGSGAYQSSTSSLNMDGGAGRPGVVIITEFRKT